MTLARALAGDLFAMADGSIPFVRARRIPVVSFLAAAISDVASALLLIIWTVSIIPTYVQWHLRARGRPWGAFPGWVMLLEDGCVAIGAGIIWLSRAREPVQAGTLSD